MKAVFAFVIVAFVASVSTAEIEYDSNPNYEFQYAVSDPLTGDTKSQSETRNGDNVQGVYQLLEPDGTYRTVTYVADPIGGFRASVSKTGSPEALKIAKPVPVVPKPAPLPVVQPARIIPAPAPKPVPAPVIPSPSLNYPYYAYPYSAYPYYQQPYYSGYYNPYYSGGYYPYYNYKK